jgi:hypothetical protein
MIGNETKSMPIHGISGDVDIPVLVGRAVYEKCPL